MDDCKNKTTGKAVTNHEKPYSIGPADRENAPADKSVHLAWIRDVRTDARPLSLRTKSVQAAAGKTS